MKKIENKTKISSDLTPLKIKENQIFNKKKFFSTKIFIFILISFIICILGASLTLLILYLKQSKNHKNEISDFETEKKF